MIDLSPILSSMTANANERKGNDCRLGYFLKSSQTLHSLKGIEFKYKDIQK
jgi:hypothetical protein